MDRRWHDVPQSGPSPPTFPSPATAALLSAFVPGAGQLTAGERRRGFAMLGATAGMLFVAAAFYLQGDIFLARLAVQPRFLVALLIVNSALLVFRAFAVVDAYLVVRYGRDGGSGRRLAITGIIAIAITGALLVIPHAAFGYYDLVAHDTLTSIFGADETASENTAETVATQGPAVAGAVTPTTVAVEPALWEGKERLNIVLLGGDAGVGRSGIRTDTIIVVSIDPETGWSAMFSIPRNVVNVPLPAGLTVEGCNCWPTLINELYPYGIEHPELFGGGDQSGANALKAALGELLGIPIHHYALVNLEGFVSLIDALGGVTIDVATPVHDAEYPHEDGTTEVIGISAGLHHMDGHMALAYARSRRESDDYSRMGRQRCVLEAAAAQADPARLLLAFPTLAGILKDNLETDIPLSQLPDLVELASKVDTSEIVSIPIVPPTYTAEWQNRYPVPDVDLIRAHVDVVMQRSPRGAMAALELSPLGDTCREE